MDLLTLAARLFLDTSEYDRALDAAAQSASSFSANLQAQLDAARAATDATASAFVALAGSAPAWGSDLIAGFISGIHRMWGSLTDTVAAVARTVRDYLGFSEPKLGPLSNFHTYAPDMMALFAQGIRDNARLVTDQFDESLDLSPAPGALPARAPAADAARPIQIIFEIDGAQKWVYNANRAEQQRVGVKLTGSVM